MYLRFRCENATRSRATQMTKAPECPGALAESGRRDSNPRPSPWQGDALPAEPRPRCDREIYQPGALSGHPPNRSGLGVAARAKIYRERQHAVV